MTQRSDRFRMGRLGIVALVVALAALGCLRGAAPPEDLAPWATPDAHFNRLLARDNGGWTGGDGTLSIPLPDGRSVWLFGDSLLGTVDPDGRRAPDTPFIRNCLMVQEGDHLVTRHGGRPEAPADFFPAPAEGAWYWPGHGMATEGGLRVFLHRFHAPSAGLWGWEWTGTALATLSLPDLRLEGIQPLPNGNGVLYGVCLLAEGDWVYIFGTRDAVHPKEAHVARAAPGRLAGPWEYFDGRAWSPRPQDSAAVLKGVSTQYAVVRWGAGHVLVTMDGRVPFADAILLFRAEAPQGPWGDAATIWRAPEAGGDVVAYNPFAHPQFQAAEGLLVSYNLNHIRDPEALYRNAALYRPRFIRVVP